MGGRVKDLTGLTFHMLTVLWQEKSKDGYARWLCQCECTKLKIVRGHSLTTGNTKSCGCMRGELCKMQNTKRFAVINGVKMSFREIEKKYGLSYQVIRYRYNVGMRGNMLIKGVGK